jgi:phage FluMu protein Com
LFRFQSTTPFVTADKSMSSHRKPSKTHKRSKRKSSPSKSVPSPVPKRSKPAHTPEAKDAKAKSKDPSSNNKTANKNPYGVFKKPDLVLIASDCGIAHANDRKVPELRSLLLAQGKTFPSAQDLVRLRGVSSVPDRTPPPSPAHVRLSLPLRSRTNTSPISADEPGLGLGAMPPQEPEVSVNVSTNDNISSDSDDEVKVILERPHVHPMFEDGIEGDQKYPVTDRTPVSTTVNAEAIKTKVPNFDQAKQCLSSMQKPTATRPPPMTGSSAIQFLEDMQRAVLEQAPVSAINKISKTAVCAHCHTVFDKAFFQCPGCKVLNPTVTSRRHCSSMSCNEESMDADALFCKRCGSVTFPGPMQSGPEPNGQRASALSRANQRLMNEGKYLEMDLFLPSLSGPASSSVAHATARGRHSHHHSSHSITCTKGH